LEPLAKHLGLPVSALYSSDQETALAESVLRMPAYRGKTVIICWTHHNVAQLARALGVRPQPLPWKEKTFDRLWVITFPANGPAQLRDLPQHLLAGDAKR
jgi:hypothetical protein